MLVQMIVVIILLAIMIYMIYVANSHKWEYIGIGKEYHCYGFYYVYEVWICTDCGKVKKKNLYRDSIRGSDCSTIPVLHELLKR